MIRVISYNIRKCVGLDLRRDPARVLSVLGAMGGDIVALQEVDRRFGRRTTALPAEMVREVTGLELVTLDHGGKGHGWHGNSLLLRPGIEVRAVECLNLPGLEPRGAVLAELQVGQARLRVVALHLGLMARHRQQQMVALERRLAGGDVPTVVMGDFNEWRMGQGPHLSAVDLHSPGHSFPSRLPVAGFDRIGTTSGVTRHDSGVFRGGAAPHASDHLPVWADLELTA